MPCSHALCLLKIADSYLALHEPWHALGYLEACLPMRRELGLARRFGRAQEQLAACQAELVQARLLAPALPLPSQPVPPRPGRR